MNPHPATAVLRAEHDRILQVLRLAESAADRIDRGERPDPGLLADFVDFFRHYADGTHHAKEEDLLFPALQQRGMPVEGGPIGVMLFEHDNGRAFVREMDAAAAALAEGDAGAGTRWATAARQFAALLRAHIDKENHVLFVMAERILTSDEQAALAAAYAGLDDDPARRAERARLLALVERLAAA